MGCDALLKTLTNADMAFQSTQPEWAATAKAVKRNAEGRAYFNPRSPSGLRHQAMAIEPEMPYFNPRSPSGLRPCPDVVQDRLYRGYFNPRSPSGLRHKNTIPANNDGLFQSTQPEWAATVAQANASQYGIYFNPRSPSGLRQHHNQW